MTEDKLLLNLNETVERLGLGRSTVIALIKSGELRSIRIGTARRIAVADLEEFINKARSAGEIPSPQRPREGA